MSHIIYKSIERNKCITIHFYWLYTYYTRSKEMKNMIKKLVVLTFATMLLLVGCGKGEAEKTADGLLTGKHYVEMEIQDKGVIKLELDADAAPITVTNFVKLVEEGFYDGIAFHRIINGFMMQGGDPEGTGAGGSAETIYGEFASNGYDNPIKHERGVISMARTGEPNSASSQFFIMHQTSEGLDGEYAAFGKVTEGMEIVDDICENTLGGDSNGIIPVENRPVIKSVKVVK